jgi:hypothetical protein
MLTFGLGTLFYVSLLLINAVAILNKERFLLKGGLAAGCWVLAAGFWLRVRLKGSSRVSSPCPSPHHSGLECQLLCPRVSGLQTPATPLRRPDPAVE